METPTPQRHISDIAFTPAVKAQQKARGSRDFYEGRDWSDHITPDVAAFIAERDSFFFATARAGGPPYIQHRGEIGRAHVITPVTNAHHECRLLLEKKKRKSHTRYLTA